MRFETLASVGIIFLRDLATAGVAIGPYSPVVQLVSDLDHIQILAQVGLVFLMFGIGLGLSFARLQRMGFSIFAAIIISSIFLFNLCRLFGVTMGWTVFKPSSWRER